MLIPVYAAQRSTRGTRKDGQRRKNRFNVKDGGALHRRRVQLVFRESIKVELWHTEPIKVRSPHDATQTITVKAKKSKRAYIADMLNIANKKALAAMHTDGDIPLAVESTISSIISQYVALFLEFRSKGASPIGSTEDTTSSGGMSGTSASAMGAAAKLPPSWEVFDVSVAQVVEEFIRAKEQYDLSTKVSTPFGNYIRVPL